MATISAIIITFNEQRNIERCLRSLQAVADEIIVVDAKSTDSTRQICRSFGAIVIEREWAGYAAAKNHGNDQSTCDYILSIDADEEISQDLARSILKIKSHLTGVYLVNRLTCYCGHWVKYCGWYPDRKIRLFPKGQCRWVGDYVHEHLECPEHVARNGLDGDLLHYSFPTLSDHLHRIDRYSALAAKELFHSGKRAGWAKILLKPTAKFLKTYLLQQGFRDGFYGFIIAALSGFDLFLRYVRLRQLWRGQHF